MNTRQYFLTAKVLPTLLSLTSMSVVANLPALANPSSQGGTEQAPTEAPVTSPTEAPSGTSQPLTQQAPTVAPPTVQPPTVAPPTVQPPTVAPPVASPDSVAAPTDGNPEESVADPAVPSEAAPPTNGTPGAATPGENESGVDQSAQTPIPETELKQFATAIPQLSSIEKSTNGEITQIIQQSGLSSDKFSSLVGGKQSGTPPEATAEEQQSFEKAITEIQAVEKKGQAQQEEVIRSQGMEPQRFVQILAAVRQDPSLKSKVQQILQTPN